MTGARRLHSATQLNTSSNPTTSGKVLIAGGIDGTTQPDDGAALQPDGGNLGRRPAT